MFLKKLPILLLLIALGAITRGSNQTNKTDSLLQRLQTSPEKGKANIYNELSWLFSGVDADQSLKYGNKALSASEANNLLREKFNALSNIAYAYELKDSLEKAAGYYNMAYKVAAQINDTQRMARAQYALGYLSTNRGLNDSALEHLIQSLKYLESLNEKNPSVDNEKHISFITNTIGVVFTRMGDKKKAMEYYQYSLSIRKKLKDSLSIANMLNNIGLLYADENKLDTALKYYGEALRIEQKAGDSLSMAETMFNSWEILIKKKQYEKAAPYFDTLKSFFSFLPTRSKIIALQNETGIWFALDKPDKALTYIRQAKALLDKSKLISLESKNYLLLSDYYAMKSDYNKAYQYQKKYIKINDSIMNSEVASRLAEMQTRYETEKKEKKIAILEIDKQLSLAEAEKQRSMKIIYLTVSLVIILLLGFFIFEIRNRDKRKQQQLEKRNLENEQKLLRAQMNPHFIFNSLNTVQSFISANDSFKAMTFLSKFGKLLRSILENSRENLITLDNELEALQLYIDLEKQKAGNRFDYQINVDKKPDSENILIPPLIIQPYVENAIKHGLKSINNGGLLNIDIYKQDKHLKIIITDNGIGRQKAGKATDTTKGHHKSLGMKLTAERLKNTGKALGGKASWQIIDLFNKEGEPAGTKVILLIPFNTL